MNGKLSVALLFLPPALLLFTLFVALPMGEAAWYSVYSWNGYGAPENFVGLKNYELLLQDRAFRTALVNNLLIIVVSLALQLPLALAMAKRVIDTAYDGPLHTGLELEGLAYGLLRQTHDFREGVEAFVEKRPPDFTGA